GAARPGAAHHHSHVRPRPGTVLRPTMRGVLVAVVAALAWVRGDLTRIIPARSLAAALLMALLPGLLCALPALIGLRARRHGHAARPPGPRLAAWAARPGPRRPPAGPLARALPRRVRPVPAAAHPARRRPRPRAPRGRGANRPGHRRHRHPPRREHDRRQPRR